jgi:hypothetical protein
MEKRQSQAVSEAAVPKGRVAGLLVEEELNEIERPNVSSNR